MFAIKHHFGTQTRRMLAVLWLALAVGLAVALAWPAVGAWLAVDRCLDAGGRFDHAARACVLDDLAPR